MTKAWQPLLRIVIGVAIAVGCASYFSSVSSDHRHTIYAIQCDLRSGMRMQEVFDVVRRHDEPFLHKYLSQDSVTLWVHTSPFADSCSLGLTFEEGTLRSARIRGEDGPHEKFADAPPDIE